MKRILAIVALSCITLSFIVLTSCDSPNNSDNTNYNNGAEIRYSKNSTWVKKLHDLNNGKNIKFRIVQLGDSHTAGDYFTGELRTQLQRSLGNGGIGLVAPTAVSGQRNAQIKYNNAGWQTFTSYKQHADFPLGGVSAQNANQSSVSLSPLISINGLQNIQIYAKPQNSSAVLSVQDELGNKQQFSTKSTNWQLFSGKFALPFSYQALSGNWSVGQIRIENDKPGITFSALGINGAQLSHTSRWHSNWINELKLAETDLVILAFGTNEAANERLDVNETEREWQRIIHQIQKNLPDAGILIVGAPESLKSTGDLCGNRLAMLDKVQAMQQRVAKKMNIAYWSWQNAMGGHCSMRTWIAKGLARQDGVHFTAEGYQQAARHLAQLLISVAK